MTVLSYLDADPKTHVPMTREQSEMFIRCTMMDQAKPQLFTQAEADQCGPIGKILYHRLQLAGPVEVTLGTALMVMTLTGGVPGKIVMWGYTLNRMCKKKMDTVGKSPITMDDLAFCFAYGFPNEQEEHRLWDAQKGHLHGRKCDNMVDQMDTWQLTESEPHVDVENNKEQG